MESQHTAKNINVSVRKVRTFLPAMRKMSPVDALTRLELLPHSAARALAQALQTVIANAETSLKVSKDMLEFRKLYADQGLVLKRFRAGSRGTAKPITHRMTHITVVLGVKKINTSPMVRTVEPAKPKKTETETKPVVKKEIKTKASKPKEKVTKSKKVSKQ
jgi:large subunit ribosomal protein L22